MYNMSCYIRTCIFKSICTIIYITEKQISIGNQVRAVDQPKKMQIRLSGVQGKLYNTTQTGDKCTICCGNFGRSYFSFRASSLGIDENFAS